MSEGKIEINAVPHAALEIEQSRKIQHMNKAAEGIGVIVGTYCWDTFGKLASLTDQDKSYYETHKRAPSGGTKCVFCKADEALAKQQHIVIQQNIGDTLWEIHWVPVGPQKYIHYGIDITPGRGNASK